MTLNLVALVDMVNFYGEKERREKGSVAVGLTVETGVQVYKGGRRWC